MRQQAATPVDQEWPGEARLSDKRGAFPTGSGVTRSAARGYGRASEGLDAPAQVEAFGAYAPGTGLPTGFI